MSITVTLSHGVFKAVPNGAVAGPTDFEQSSILGIPGPTEVPTTVPATASVVIEYLLVEESTASCVATCSPYQVAMTSCLSEAGFGAKPTETSLADKQDRTYRQYSNMGNCICARQDVQNGMAEGGGLCKEACGDAGEEWEEWRVEYREMCEAKAALAQENTGEEPSPISKPELVGAGVRVSGIVGAWVFACAVLGAVVLN